MPKLKFILMMLAVCTPVLAEDASSNGEGYQRCAACHLPSGEGIPGAFPPLKNRVAKIASTDPGRAYLVAVVNSGLMGSITVDGIPYMGVMPAQGSMYDAAGISSVLNYSVQVIDAENANADWKPFSAVEVETLLNAGSSQNGQATLRLREALIEKYPELQ